MSYNRINNIVGWAVCLIACVVYMMTKEATVSFWDCGEFTSGAAKLEVVHSPGAPLFLMIGRLFVILFGMKNAGFALNTLSAISSGFTILFLFFKIKKIININNSHRFTSFIFGKITKIFGTASTVCVNTKNNKITIYFYYKWSPRAAFVQY